ncbi:hypothetical protein CDEST_05782 [Colletotrichum destructivum]|uniref:Uncharacterized protein n=1 Tax=Colletotrichum destructivum TaxID=34406 RepID=A0AAX4ICQ0_9PEZI|nr:hypothetical protein CDEST_05782 [Colletotrichum destructivum]
MKSQSIRGNQSGEAVEFEQWSVVSRATFEVAPLSVRLMNPSFAALSRPVGVFKQARSRRNRWTAVRRPLGGASVSLAGQDSHVPQPVSLVEQPAPLPSLAIANFARLIAVSRAHHGEIKSPTPILLSPVRHQITPMNRWRDSSGWWQALF